MFAYDIGNRRYESKLHAFISVFDSVLLSSLSFYCLVPVLLCPMQIYLIFIPLLNNSMLATEVWLLARVTVVCDQMKSYQSNEI